MIEIDLHNSEWTDLRQLLALALVNNKPLVLNNVASLFNTRGFYLSVFEDLMSITRDLNLGKLELQDEVVSFIPNHLKPGNYKFSTSKFSSVSEIVLFLLPAMFYSDFRSVVNLTGVTHTNILNPIGFLKESLLPHLEEYGYLSSLSLKRFGFFGSGGGLIETRVYPEETDNCFWKPPSGIKKIDRIQIYISGLKTDIAMEQKSDLCQRLNCNENDIAVVEVLDSDGPGKVIGVTIEHGDRPFYFSYGTEFFNDAGDYIFDKSEDAKAIDLFIEDIKKYLNNDSIQKEYLKEIAPFVYLVSGFKEIEKMPLESEYLNLLKSFPHSIG